MLEHCTYSRARKNAVQKNSTAQVEQVERGVRLGLVRLVLVGFSDTHGMDAMVLPSPQGEIVGLCAGRATHTVLRSRVDGCEGRIW